MSVTTVFLEKKGAIINLKKLSDKMSEVGSSISKINALKDQGILDSEEAEEIVSGYKDSIKKAIEEELQKAKEESKMISSASETEVNSKVKGITPIIAGIPVITPIPAIALASEASFLVEAGLIGVDFLSMINKFNSALR